jgi:outer membrane receptor protein involved in Fe transport
VNSIATNQGSAEIWGLELELQAALTDSLLVGFGYTFSRPRFTEGCDDQQYVLNTGGFSIPGPVDSLTPAQLEACSIEGNRLPLTSEHQASLNARYTRQLARGYEWFVSGDVTYESSKFAQVHNRAETGSATIAGLQLGIESDRLRVALFGRNIFDEDAVVNVTRWGDVAYGFAFIPGSIRAPASVDGQAVQRSAVLGPRAFFTTLRRGASYGIQASYRF